MKIEGMYDRGEPEKSIFCFKACRLFLQRLCREPAVN